MAFTTAVAWTDGVSDGIIFGPQAILCHVLVRQAAPIASWMGPLEFGTRCTCCPSYAWRHQRAPVHGVALKTGKKRRDGLPLGLTRPLVLQHRVASPICFAWSKPCFEKRLSAAPRCRNALYEHAAPAALSAGCAFGSLLRRAPMRARSTRRFRTAGAAPRQPSHACRHTPAGQLPPGGSPWPCSRYIASRLPALIRHFVHLCVRASGGPG